MTSNPRIVSIVVLIVVLVALNPSALRATTDLEIDRESNPAATLNGSGASATSAMKSIPVAFEPNVGQTAASVDFVARTRSSAVLISGNTVRIQHTVAGLATRPDGALVDNPRSPAADRVTGMSFSLGPRRASGTEPVPADPLPSVSHYLVGEQTTWHRNVPNFGSLHLPGVADGVVASLSATQSHLVVTLDAATSESLAGFEFDVEQLIGLHSDLFESATVVAKCGDRPLRMSLDRGAGSSRHMTTDEMLPPLPARATVSIPYVLTIGGGNAPDIASGVAIAADGSAVVSGTTYAVDFPVTAGSYDTAFGTPETFSGFTTDAFVSRVSADGSTLLWSTYFGGVDDDKCVGVAVMPDGSIAFAGTTKSYDFPTTPGALDRSINDQGVGDGFVARFSSDGQSLIASTFLGASNDDVLSAIVATGDGDLFVCGNSSSSDFPTTAQAFDATLGGPTDAIIVKLAGSLDTLRYSTFLGGTTSTDIYAGRDVAYALATDSSGAAYVTGKAGSSDFPTTAGAYNRTYLLGNAFVAKITPTGSALAYSTLVSGGVYGCEGYGIAVDAVGAAYVTGRAERVFPTTPGAFDTTTDLPSDAYALKLNAAGSALVYSTILGGAGWEIGRSIALGSSGEAVVVGQTGSTDFPTTAGAFDRTQNGGLDIFVTRLNANGTALVFSSFLGGSLDDDAAAARVFADGEVLVVGTTLSTDFPTTAGSFDRTHGDAGSNALVARIASTGSALAYSTFLGGTSSIAFGVDDSARAVAVGPDGSVFVAGTTAAPVFPVTGGAVDGSFNGVEDAVVVKLAPGGTAVVWSTYIGGSSFDDARDIVIRPNGRPVLFGRTSSPDFPVLGGYDLTLADQGDSFVLELEAAGSAIAVSTFLGGERSDDAGGIALGSDGSVYVAGTTFSSSFPVTVGAFDETFNGQVTHQGDAYLTRFSPGLDSLIFSTYFGGTFYERCDDIAIATDQSAVVVGKTISTDLPTTPGSADQSANGSDDGFAARISSSGAVLLASTYVGGQSIDEVTSVCVDATGAFAIAGLTVSDDFPLSPSAFDTEITGGSSDAFVLRLSESLAFVAGTLIGNNYSDVAYDVALLESGRLVIVGYTQSSTFPTTAGAPDSINTTSTDGFVSVFSESLTTLTFSTYVGERGPEFALGVAAAGPERLVVVGESGSFDFGNSTLGARDDSSIFVSFLDLSIQQGADTPGAFVGATAVWFLRNSNSGGAADTVLSFGAGDSGWTPLRGDWNGDGADTTGLYDGATGVFFLTDVNASGPASKVYGFGPGGAGWLPLTGDWNGDGIDTVGLYAPDTGVFFLRNEHAPGGADLVYGFGPSGLGWIPVAGDWDGDGLDTVGLYAPASGTFFLRNVHAPGGADLAYSFGPVGAGWRVFAGDFDGDGVDTIGLYSPSNGFYFLKNSHGPGAADVVFGFGPPNLTALTGDWDGR